MAGTAASYVKPHGALYNAVVHPSAQAAAVVAAISDYGATLPVLGLPGSELLHAAEAAGPVPGSSWTAGYPTAGTLVARSEPEALLHAPDEVTERVSRLLSDGVVRAVDGSDVVVTAEPA